jgi:hypothetical protein
MSIEVVLPLLDCPLKNFSHGLTLSIFYIFLLEVLNLPGIMGEVELGTQRDVWIESFAIKNG